MAITDYTDLKSLDKAIEDIVDPAPKKSISDTFWDLLGYNGNKDLVKDGISNEASD